MVRLVRVTTVQPVQLGKGLVKKENSLVLEALGEAVSVRSFHKHLPPEKLKLAMDKTTTVTVLSTKNAAAQMAPSKSASQVLPPIVAKASVKTASKSVSTALGDNVSTKSSHKRRSVTTSTTTATVSSTTRSNAPVKESVVQEMRSAKPVSGRLATLPNPPQKSAAIKKTTIVTVVSMKAATVTLAPNNLAMAVPPRQKPSLRVKPEAKPAPQTANGPLSAKDKSHPSQRSVTV